MSRSLIFAAAALAAAVTVPQAFARGPMGPPDRTAMLETRVERLNLDDATRAAVRRIINEAKPVQSELQDRMREEHESLRTLLGEETPDQSAVLAEADRIGTTMTELRKHELRTLLAVRAQLTPEQQKSLMPPDHEGGCDGHGHDKSREAAPED
jgi:Spy/CpxP family protein refolding chaperone